MSAAFFFLTVAAPALTVIQFYWELTSLYEAVHRGVNTGDWRLLGVRVSCSALRLGVEIVQARLISPRCTLCGLLRKFRN